MDYGAIPPEINSARMYAGAGSGPLLGAATAWQELAHELTSQAGNYASEIDGLGSVWSGPSAEAFATSASRYVSWMATTAATAEQTANQARLAAAAYVAAHTATVAPSTVTANRTQLAALVATNVLGVNTAAIMATEAQYGEFWAQDAAAMYQYATASAAATRLPPTPRRPKPRPPAPVPAVLAQAAQPSQSLAGFLDFTSLPNDLSLLSVFALATPYTATMGTVGAGFGIGSYLGYGAQAGGQPYGMNPASAPNYNEPGSRMPAAGWGQAALLGKAKMAVPPNWVLGAPQARLVALASTARAAAPVALDGVLQQSMLGNLAGAGVANLSPRGDKLTPKKPAEPDGTQVSLDKVALAAVRDSIDKLLERGKP